MKNLINWKLFFILLVTCVITSLLVIPYAMAITSNQNDVSDMSFVRIILSTIISNSVLFAAAVFLGLFSSKRIGMGLPVLEGFLEGKNQTKELKSIFIPSAGLGALAGVLIVLLSIPFNRLIPEFQNITISVAAWKALLASFYGGIAEEVLLRLCLVSILAWISFLIKKTKDNRPTDIGIWLSIILSAVIFGLGHLPVTAQIVSLTPVVVVRAVVLNGVGGIIFGWLYWKKGLESAMIAHFTADIILHIITPFVVSFLGIT